MIISDPHNIEDGINTRANCFFCADFDETSGSIAYDSSGNHDGVYAGTCTLDQTGLVDKSVLFTASGRASFGTSSDFTPNKDISYNVIFKPTTNFTSVQVLFYKQDEVSAFIQSNSIFFYILAGNTNNFNYIRVSIANAGLVLNEWNKATFTFDSTQALIKNGMNMYCNGNKISLVARVSSSSTSNSLPTTTANQFICYGNSAGTQGLLGYGDQVRVYHENLDANPALIQRLHSGVKW